MSKKKNIINFSLVIFSVMISLFIVEIFIKLYDDNTLDCLTNRELKEKRSVKFGYNYDKRFISSSNYDFKPAL